MADGAYIFYFPLLGDRQREYNVKVKGTKFKFDNGGHYSFLVADFLGENGRVKKCV